MKADKLRELDTKELDAQVREAREQLFRLRFQMSMGQMEGVPQSVAREAMLLAAHKLPIRTRFVAREGAE